jgi:hypothetical protein
MPAFGILTQEYPVVNTQQPETLVSTDASDAMSEGKIQLWGDLIS